MISTTVDWNSRRGRVVARQLASWSPFSLLFTPLQVINAQSAVPLEQLVDCAGEPVDEVKSALNKRRANWPALTRK